nr:MAG TPA: hypothetical protein [Caudoviricetes sp.]
MPLATYYIVTKEFLYKNLELLIFNYLTLFFDILAFGCVRLEGQALQCGCR